MKRNSLDSQTENSLLSMTSQEVEMLIIRSLIEYPQLYFNVENILTEDCFFHPLNKGIFRYMRDRILNKAEVDFVQICGGLIKDVGPQYSSHLAKIFYDIRPTSILEEHAMFLATLNLRRNVYVISKNLCNGMTDLRGDVDALIEDARRQIANTYSLSEDDLESGDKVYEQLQLHICMNRNRAPGEIFGTPTGFDDLDKAGGLCPGDLTIVGAETSQGKTSFATALAHSAITKGHDVAFYSMEMSAMQVMARIAAMRSGISSSRQIVGRIEASEQYYIDAHMDKQVMKHIHFDSKSNSNLENLLMSIRRQKMKHDIKGVVIDYLQLVHVSDRSMNREQATAQCAREFKNIAKELGIWVIVISQLSRSQGNSGHAPSMSRLRDSGQIEEAADNVMLIFRPAKGESYPYPHEDVPTQGTAMIAITKGRNTGVGSFICGFDPALTLFYPLNGTDPRFATPPVATPTDTADTFLP